MGDWDHPRDLKLSPTDIINLREFFSMDEGEMHLRIMIMDLPVPNGLIPKI